MKRLMVVCSGLLALAMPARSEGPPATDGHADLRALVRGNNAFAFDLYARLRHREGNLFCSPYSISTALGMTHAGARGATAEEMAKVLHFGLEPKRLHPAFANLIREFGPGSGRLYQLRTAQSLWGATDLRLNEDFNNLLQGDYGARLHRVHFGKDTTAARGEINRWVAEQTNDKIKELLHSEDVDASTRLVLANAIYFKAAWDKPFSERGTDTNARFWAAGKEVRAAMMHQTGKLPYMQNKSVQVLALPYKGGDLWMIVVLPREKDGLAKVEESFTTAKLAEWVEAMKVVEVGPGLPRFKFEARFHLKKELEAMGMPLAFGSGANFSGISREKLKIDDVIHQANVDVNEAGTEAAAATAVTTKAFDLGSGRPVEFHADHPFLFLLRDSRTGSILFVGRVVDPGAAVK